MALWLNQEVEGPVQVENPDGGSGTALVVDHAGRGSFHRRVVAGFVHGLVDGGWRVEVATASSRAPGDLAGYDLLVLGTPIYGFAPSRPIRRYLKRLGDLAGQPKKTNPLAQMPPSSRVIGACRFLSGDHIQASRDFALAKRCGMMG